MIVAGLGMGLLMPVYTVAVQNVAPYKQMGAATASTVFFRAIGSTVGVAIFGSVMLTDYHRRFADSVPSSAPSTTVSLFSNPLMLRHMQPQLDATFGASPQGRALLQTLLVNVRASLGHGLHLIFVLSAALMAATLFLHAALPVVALRADTPLEPDIPMH
jgi:hypothetical protein